MIELIKTLFKLYISRELFRGRGLIVGLLGIAVWISLFTIPVTLFKPPDTPIGYVSANIFLSVTVFLSYSLATWDWASELRSIAVAGVLEYMLVSSRSILTIYIGLIPVSTVWLLLSLITVYAIFSSLSLPPILSIHSPLFLAIGILSFLQVLVAHAIMLGGTILSADVSGPIMEMLGWLIPIVTGGFTPLSSMPPQLRIVALSTPYSYPVELLRYSILGLETALSLNLMVPISLAYSLVFLLSSLLYFKRVILKMMVEGIRSIGMH